jgi:uncharacterized membrane protein
MHINKKGLNFYFAAIILFALAVIFNIVYAMLFNTFFDANNIKDNAHVNLIFGIYFGVTAFITFIAILFYKYAT